MRKNTEIKDTVNGNPPVCGGLYARVRLSLRGANILVVVCLLLLVGVTAFLVTHNGFTVSFDTRGGTPVESCRLLHSDRLTGIPDPTRAGYYFTGWYTDPACTLLWNVETDTVTESLTLYAGWEPVRDP